MSDEGAVDRYEAEIFNAALREQQAIEGIAGGWLGLNRRDDVMLADREKIEAAASDDVRQQFQIA